MNIFFNKTLSLFVISAFLTACNGDDSNKSNVEATYEQQDGKEIDGFLYKFDEANKTAEVILCLKKDESKIVMPSNVTYNGDEYAVTSIGYGVFENCSNLTSIVLSDSICRQISYSSFYGCNDKIEEITVPLNLNQDFSYLTNLKRYLVSEKHPTLSSIDGVLFNKNKTTLCHYPKGKSGSYTIPNSVEYIGTYAFAYNERLTSVIIPENVKDISAFAFMKCKGLKSIQISDGVKKIGHRAFHDAVNFESIYIPKSVMSIDNYAFDCNNELKEIIVDPENNSYCSEDGVLFIKDKSLLIKCPGGKTGKYVIPEGVEEIGCSAFDGCSKLDSIGIATSVRHIGRHAFMFCENISSIVIPEGVSTIKEMTFTGCTKLANVSLPNSLESIEEEALSQCDNLESIYIPKNLTYIDPSAFAIGKLKNFMVDENNPNYSSFDGLLLSKDSTVLLQVPSEKKTCKIPAFIQRIEASIHNVDSIVVDESNEFYSSENGLLYDKTKTKLFQCSNFKSACIINENTDTIPKYAFFYNNISSVYIPASVKVIEDDAFYHCSKLEDIKVSEKNSHYCSVNGVLLDKEKKKMLKFPEGKSKWEDLPESVEFINLSNGHYHIEHITIPKNVKGFGPYSLNTCDSLKSITFKAPEPAECTKYIFEHAKKTTIIYVPKSSVELYKSTAEQSRHKSYGSLTFKAIEE